MIYPVSGGRVTNKFSRSHPGTDYAPPKPGDTKTPCLAPETSTVVAVGTGVIEGKYVILQGIKTGKFYYFGHFSKLTVSKGRGIAEGTVIGILGKTGKATGIHTHCEVRDERNSDFSGKHDPEKWFKAHVKEEEVTSKTTAINLVRTLTHEHNPPEKIWKAWVGLTDKQLNARLVNVEKSDWFKAQTEKIKE
jgi:murein DD-endopeptidase MepM/ murein hydrolase activator NlpD